MGSKILNEGYINYIKSYSLITKKITTLLAEKDNKMSQQISNYSDNGDYCCVSKTDFWINNKYHEKIWEPSLPFKLKEMGNLYCELSDDGAKIIIFSRGVLYYAEKNMKNIVCVTNLGHIEWATFLSESYILIELTGSYHYSFKILDVRNFTVKSDMYKPDNIEWVNQYGFDVSRKGYLLISKMNGTVMKLDSDLMKSSFIQTEYGPIRQVMIVSYNGKDAFLSESGAVIMLDPETGKTDLRIGSYSKKPIKAGSGYSKISYIKGEHKKEKSFMMYRRVKSLNIFFGSTRYISMEKSLCTIEMYDSINNKSKKIYEIELDFPVCDSTTFMDKALILLENGRVILIDPFEVPQSNFPTIINKIPFPKGITSIANDKIVVWTKDSLIYYELSESYEVIQKKIKKISGINKVKWDELKQRFIIAFAKYIGFWSKDLEEMYRLYILTGDSILIHVPLPLRTQIASSSPHPGYFWSDTDCVNLFEVKTIDSKIVSNQDQKKDFLSQYFKRSIF